MGFDLQKLNGSNITQLGLDLNLDEVEAEGSIDFAEAQRRSDASLQAFKLLLTTEKEKQKEYTEALKKYQTDLAKRRRNNLPILDLIEPENKAVNLEWVDCFYYLLDHGWQWRVAVYIAWAASPRMGRYPETQEDLAKKILGLTSDRQISTWRKKNPTIDETIVLIQAMSMMLYRGDVIKALAISASDTSHRGAADRRTYLTGTGDYVPHVKIDEKRSSSNPMDLSDAELDEIIKRGGGK